MRRGEVWWARNEAYDVRELVIVAPVTTRMRRIPTEVPLGPEDGVPKACAVSREKLAAVERALRFALGLTTPSL